MENTIIRVIEDEFGHLTFYDGNKEVGTTHKNADVMREIRRITWNYELKGKAACFALDERS